MRGVRIQSIVNELGGEKIDVAQWSPDTKVFIANALSPAKVLNVILQDIDNDKTAMVVVPDKQLSLAIGKEGQNARLAAKLTGWRIDIKSAIEAAQEALSRASASQAIKARVSGRPEVFSLAASILEERSEGVELSQGELQLLSEMIELVGQAALSVAREEREAEMAARAARAARMASEDVDLLAEAEAILAETGPTDFIDEAAGLLEEYLLDSELAEVTDDAVDTEADEPVKAQAQVDQLAEALEVVEADESTELLDLAADMLIAEEVAEGDMDEVVEVEAKGDEETGEEFIPSILASVVEAPKKEKKRLKPVFVDEEETDLEDPEAAKRRTKTKSRTLEYDENLGQVVAKRHRKRSRRKDDWTEFYDDE
jgi:N utilization substance protein A